MSVCISSSMYTVSFPQCAIPSLGKTGTPAPSPPLSRQDCTLVSFLALPIPHACLVYSMECVCGIVSQYQLCKFLFLYT